MTKADAVNFPRDCWSSMERHYGEMAELVAADSVRSVEAFYTEGADFSRRITSRWHDLVLEQQAWAARPQRARRHA